MKTIRGDLIQLALDGNFDVIIHGCNCFCTMGAGIAKSIKEIFPEAYEADQNTKSGSKEKLGTYSLAEVMRKNHKIEIINAYIQFSSSGAGTLVNYDALREVFIKIKSDFSGKRIGYPKIGAGLAKGDWQVISKIIDEELSGEDHTLVEYIKDQKY